MRGGCAGNGYMYRPTGAKNIAGVVTIEMPGQDLLVFNFIMNMPVLAFLLHVKISWNES